ncbi:MAG: hypothetical protein VXX24_07945 [Pseudomonadota bacterium]|nr:hypothetical protein [Pseudomonadota bacterium]
MPTSNKAFQRILTRGLAFTVSAALSAGLATTVSAQSGALVENFPEVASLNNAFDVTQAALLDAMAEINANPETMQARMEVQMQLDMAKDMNGHAHMGHGGKEMSMNMGSPYDELEVEARIALTEMLRQSHTDEAAQNALSKSASLPTHVWQVLSWGRKFERDIADIFANGSTSLSQKRAAVEVAIETYLNDDTRHAVATVPKHADLYLAHDHADGAKTAFPRLSALMWTNQWLQLASLEAMVAGQLDSQFSGKVPVTLERYWAKVGSDTGMTMYPVPVDMPSAPAIAPSFYSEAPQAAMIIDNLNRLEVAVADIIAYPNLENRDELLEAIADEFTKDDVNVSDEMEYLLSALRGGIFDQGGPAIGELGRSERNRSRDAMDMVHTMIMSGPQ